MNSSGTYVFYQSYDEYRKNFSGHPILLYNPQVYVEEAIVYELLTNFEEKTPCATEEFLKLISFNRQIRIDKMIPGNFNAKKAMKKLKQRLLGEDWHEGSLGKDQNKE